MEIYSLIAVRWDEQERLFDPIGGEHSIAPFSANGFTSFERRFYSDNETSVRIILVVTMYDSNKITEQRFHGDNSVITLTHDLLEYLDAQLARYCAQDLPFDLAREKC